MEAKMDSEPGKRKSKKEEVPKKAKVARTSGRRSKQNSKFDDTAANTKPTSTNVVDPGVAACSENSKKNDVMNVVDAGLASCAGSTNTENVMNVDSGVATCSGNTTKNDVKKIQYHYEIDLAEMAERKTINVANFRNYLRERFKNDGKIENLANTVKVEEEQWIIIVKSEIFFKKSVLKYHSKKFLKMKKLRNYVQVVGNGNLNYRFTYYKDSRQNK